MTYKLEIEESQINQHFLQNFLPLTSFITRTTHPHMPPKKLKIIMLTEWL